MGRITTLSFGFVDGRGSEGRGDVLNFTNSIGSWTTACELEAHFPVVPFSVARSTTAFCYR